MELKPRHVGADGSLQFESPSFLASPPDVRHRERIPADVLAAMQPTWDKTWFPPRAFHLSVLEDVFVAQDGLAVRSDGAVVEETIAQHSPAAVMDARRAVMAVSAGRRCPQIAGAVALCRKPGAGTYGHWLVEILPRAYLASRWPEPIRFLVQALAGPMPALVRQTLARLGIGDDGVVQAGPGPVWVERLILVHGLTEHGVYMSPVAVDCLQAIAASIAPAGAEALFITRTTHPSRRLIEETRVLSQARQAGFAVMDPGTMPFAAQVAAFKAARRIVGVMGSALANLAFAEPGTEVFILAPDLMPDTFFWFLSSHRRLSLTEMRCATAPPRTGHSAWDLSVRLDAADQDIVLDRTARKQEPAQPLFDAAFYRASNPDVAAADVDPLQHYIEHGWREDRLPSRLFDGVGYLAAYQDVRASGMNPLVHFLRYGCREGRKAFGF